MDKSDYVSYEVAKLLKTKGYNEPCDGYYHNDNDDAYHDCQDDDRFELCWTQGSFINENNFYRDAAPTLYEAQKWLREKHNLHISVGMYGDCSYDADGKVCEEWYAWSFTIYYTTNLEHPMIDFEATCDTYEEALNEGIKEALKFI